MSAPLLFMVVVPFGDRIQVTYQQPGTSGKYLSEFLKSFEDVGVFCAVQGPFPFISPACQW